MVEHVTKHVPPRDSRLALVSVTSFLRILPFEGLLDQSEEGVSALPRGRPSAEAAAAEGRHHPYDTTETSRVLTSARRWISALCPGRRPMHSDTHADRRVHARMRRARVGDVIQGTGVARILRAVREHRHALPPIQCDSRTEFTIDSAEHLDLQNRTLPGFSRPVRPVDNAVFEAFDGSLR